MTERFEWAGPNSAKLRCTICGRTGWGQLRPDRARLPWRHWQQACLGSHDYACTCGRAFASASGLSAHVSPRRWIRDSAWRAAHQPALQEAS